MMRGKRKRQGGCEVRVSGCNDGLEYFWEILPGLLDEKNLSKAHELEFKLTDLEYLVHVAEYYGINPRKEPYLLWIIRLADMIELPIDLK